MSDKPHALKKTKMISSIDTQLAQLSEISRDINISKLQAKQICRKQILTNRVSETLFLLANSMQILSRYKFSTYVENSDRHGVRLAKKFVMGTRAH